MGHWKAVLGGLQGGAGSLGMLSPHCCHARILEGFQQVGLYGEVAAPQAIASAAHQVIPPRVHGGQTQGAWGACELRPQQGDAEVP